MKWVNNFFTLIDPNFYFFANHPHERGGIVESERFWFGLLPFFILGLLILGQKKWFVTALFAALVLGSLSGVDRGAYWLYPLIIIAIIRGLAYFFKKIKNYVAA